MIPGYDTFREVTVFAANTPGKQETPVINQVARQPKDRQKPELWLPVVVVANDPVVTRKRHRP
jgi:hypothetical protein